MNDDVSGVLHLLAVSRLTVFMAILIFLGVIVGPTFDVQPEVYERSVNIAEIGLLILVPLFFAHHL